MPSVMPQLGLFRDRLAMAEDKYARPSPEIRYSPDQLPLYYRFNDHTWVLQVL